LLLQRYNEFANQALPESWNELPLLQKTLRIYEKIPKHNNYALGFNFCYY